MFEKKQIQRKIDIIFQKESDNINYGFTFRYIDDSNPNRTNSNSVLPRDFILESMPTSAFLITDKEISIEWDTFFTLKKLYNEIAVNRKSRSMFIEIIKMKLISKKSESVGGRIRDSSSLGFYFLMKIGEMSQGVLALIELLDKCHNDKNSRFIKGGLFQDICIFMTMEPNYFDNESLKMLKILNNACVYHPDIRIYKNIFELKANEVRYINLKKELEGINEELNIDKERVIEIISKYNFPPIMTDFLLQIETIPESSEWDTINSGMIGNLRSFYEELIQNIAKSINVKTGIDFPKNPEKGDFGNKRSYIKQQLELSDNDDKLITSFVNILHKEGGHSFISEKKYYRLTKNIGIEIAYFLMSKLDTFLEK